MGDPLRLRLACLAAAGAWLGLADGLHAAYAAPDLAGPWVDRAGALAASALATALALPLALAPALALARRSARWRARAARALAWLCVAVLAALLQLGPYAAREATPDRVAAAGAFGAAVAAVAATLERALRSALRGSPRAGRLALAVAAAAWLAAPLAALPGARVVRTGGAAGPGIVLVSVDTLRADRLGTYGHALPTSPNLDAFAREGTVFERTFAQSQWTLPSHATLLTGFGPLTHGVLDVDGVLPPALPTLAERLRERGFRTAAFVGGNRYSFIGDLRGFSRGFEHYVQYPHPRRFASGLLLRFFEHLDLRMRRHHVGDAEAEVDAALRWLWARGDDPFFLFLHFYDVHSKTHRLPYEAPEPWRTAFCPEGLGDYDGCDEAGRCATDRLRAAWAGESPEPTPDEVAKMSCLYDGEVAFVDAQLGRLFAGLDRLGLAGRTLVVVTADHGEAFFEHGYPLHSNLFDEVLRVPLILRGPGVPKGMRSAAPARLLDVVPTLFDRIGVEKPPELFGHSLFRGSDAPPADFAVGTSETNSISLRKDGWKLVLRRPSAIAPARKLPPESLYDLRNDPEESRDLLADGARPAVAEQLREELVAGERLRIDRGAALRRGETSAALEIPPRERERLVALGYAVP